MTEGRLNTIVIIDDDPINNFITEREIKKQNLTQSIIIFTKASEGMSYLEDICNKPPHERPKLILLDKKMPVMDGMDLLNGLLGKEINLAEKLNIVLISSDFRNGECEEFNKLGVVDCIEKPLIEGKLEELVERFFYKSFAG